MDNCTSAASDAYPPTTYLAVTRQAECQAGVSRSVPMFTQYLRSRLLREALKQFLVGLILL